MTINGRDAFKTYGLFMTAAGLAALKAPRTPKEPVTCESRLEHGKRVILPQPGDGVGPLFESREFSMEVNMTAKTAAQFEEARCYSVSFPRTGTHPEASGRSSV